ncbi:MAG: hypothetical protein BM557_01585 [Flavobacterium sp. MedPE-SWcel]|uniref:OmpA family protein n=1 Tax=uncultured Flavobacterium sp. TaxID=165435 RepID=UPI000921084E|nr:OmpA family protein [uncultured Flavobacterium sp.]OIQ22096.1 MAG: hypothetical protein BM557_01585 [Flavobacterium sp. MedPE-SWcel]
MKKLLLLFFLLAISATQAQQEVFTVYFDFNIDEVNAESKQKLIKWVTEHKNVEIQKVYGYADPVDTNTYNLELSRRRASNVFDYLVSNNVAVAQDVYIEAFGEDFKLSDNDADNRKVEVYYKNVVVSKTEKTDFIKAVEVAKKGDVLKIPNLNFYNYSDIVLRESKSVLKELLSIMQDNPELKIDIQGHICCQEREEEKISEKRAIAIYKYLIFKGIDKERLSYQSFEGTRPIHPIPEKSEKERVANRRVEIEIIDN